jgi:hypothetical protein
VFGDSSKHDAEARQNRQAQMVHSRLKMCVFIVFYEQKFNNIGDRNIMLEMRIFDELKKSKLEEVVAYLAKLREIDLSEL